jgi:hypothetical protein
VTPMPVSSAGQPIGNEAASSEAAKLRNPMSDSGGSASASGTTYGSD